MKIFILSALILLYCLIFVTAAPIFDDDDWDFSIPDITADCTNLGCPSGTISCSRKISTSRDKQTLLTTITCTDSNGRVSRNDTTSAPNQNPGSIINSYEFFGSYSGNNGVVRSSFGNDDEVETFNKK